jgi:GT2 family glycosyltransferase
MKGLAIWYEPAAKAFHAGGHSVRKLAWDRRAEYWYASLLGYSAKHFTRPEVILVAAAVAGGAVIRSAMGIVAVRSLKPVAIYGKVIRLACRYLSLPVAAAAEAVLEKHS